jgi:AAA+ superfamily predicted ATPase
MVRKVVEALAAEERGNRHTVLADNLSNLLYQSARRPTSMSMPPSQAELSASDALIEIRPKRRLSDLVLPPAVFADIELLIEEQHRAELLRAYNLEPRHRVLLVGPPGNGKTSCAEAIAAELSVPLLILRYETVITSFLGETSARLAAALDDARARHCVLFIDEFDTMAKERGDEHDTGEIKRVVSTLLLQLDRLPSHVVVCAATNHSELLDRAVWRRFQLRLEFPPPTRDERARFIHTMCERMGMRLGRTPRTLADKLGAASYAELEEFVLEVRRRDLLSGAFDDASPAVVDSVLAAWKHRAKPPVF